MLKILILSIILILSPTYGLLENLFQAENDCYMGCNSNYAEHLSNLDACKKGCNFKLHNENCAQQCKSLSMDGQIQASCLVGCSMKNAEINPPTEIERPRSIILIRLRQRPLFPFLSFNNDPVEMFNKMIKQFKEDTNMMEQSNELKTIAQLAKSIPIIKLLNDGEPNQIRQSFIYRQDKFEPLKTRFQQFTDDIYNQWNYLVRNQPKLPIWILLAVFICSSAVLWYMIVSLCQHAPKHHTLSVRAQELILDDACEKEKLQSSEQYFEEKEPLSFKIKLSNV